MRPRDVGATDAWAAALNDTTPGAAARIKALDTPEARIAARSKAYRTPEGEPWNTTHDKVMKGINEGNPPPWVSWRPGFPGDTPYPPMKPKR
jgi:hypothetical protein